MRSRNCIGYGVPTAQFPLMSAAGSLSLSSMAGNAHRTVEGPVQDRRVATTAQARGSHTTYFSAAMVSLRFPKSAGQHKNPLGEVLSCGTDAAKDSSTIFIGAWRIRPLPV
jgi:hypothetical protein